MPDRERDELLYRQAMHLAAQLPIETEDRNVVLRYMRELCERKPCERAPKAHDHAENVCKFERRGD